MLAFVGPFALGQGRGRRLPGSSFRAAAAGHGTLGRCARHSPCAYLQFIGRVGVGRLDGSQALLEACTQPLERIWAVRVRGRLLEDGRRCWRQGGWPDERRSSGQVHRCGRKQGHISGPCGSLGLLCPGGRTQRVHAGQDDERCATGYCRLSRLRACLSGRCLGSAGRLGRRCGQRAAQQHQQGGQRKPTKGGQARKRREVDGARTHTGCIGSRSAQLEPAPGAVTEFRPGVA